MAEGPEEPRGAEPDRPQATVVIMDLEPVIVEHVRRAIDARFDTIARQKIGPAVQQAVASYDFKPILQEAVLQYVRLVIPDLDFGGQAIEKMIRQEVAAAVHSLITKGKV